MNTNAEELKSSSAQERGWLIAVLVCALVLYVPTMVYLVGRWRADAQYSLAFLVPFVSGYFIWKKWPEVKTLRRSPCVWGLVLILFALAIHVAGVLLDISGPSSVSLLLFILGACLYFHSAALVKTLAFPLAYMVFMIPIPGGVLDLVGFPLQLWASGAAAALLRLLGLEVYRSGVNMSVPGFDFQVAQACSGLSSLVALVGVTAVFAYLTSLPAVFKWFLFVLALPIALAANVVRVTIIALAGYQWGHDVAMHIFHNWSSPILFVTAVVLMFLISLGFEWISKRLTTS
ncbi:MAG: exosortase/archaeosortase family protein [Armatimonadota bacterium]|nr:exosortase/archaeosortase family protein [Armatimonadota bacterium]